MNSHTSRLATTEAVLHFRPADKPDGTPPLLLLHGWGHSSRCWEPLLPHLVGRQDIYLLDLPGFGDSREWRPASLDEVTAWVAQQLPPRCVLIGWSLGGHLALRLAQDYPDAVAGVVTLATNLRFVAGPEWPEAMPEGTFSDFCTGFAEAPAQALKRFCGLQAQGDSNARLLLKTLREQCAAPDEGSAPQWRQALQWLGEFDHRRELPRLPQALLHLYGDSDALVPAAAAAAVGSVSSGAVHLLNNAGHAFPISRPVETGRLIRQFLTTLAEGEMHRIDKGRMARSFSRAAVTYDSVAHVQEQVGRRLLRACPPVAGQRVLDVGCGTGFCSLELRKRGASLLGLDIAPGMLRQARRKLGPESALVCADAERLPFAEGNFAGIVSNLTVQWSQMLPQLLRELGANLKPGGWLLFSTLGPATLHELRQAWRAVDGRRHVNEFVAVAELRQYLEDAGYAVEKLESEQLVPRYQQLNELMHELKALGAHNVNKDQRRGLTSPRDLRRLVQAYESYRDDGGKLPATYEIFYVLARKPASHTTE